MELTHFEIFMIVAGNGSFILKTILNFIMVATRNKLNWSLLSHDIGSAVFYSMFIFYRKKNEYSKFQQVIRVISHILSAIFLVILIIGLVDMSKNY